MTRDTIRLACGSALLGAALLALTVGVLPIADALYANGLWPRLTPDEVLLKLRQDFKMNVSGCSMGTNGWHYICQLPAQPGVRQFHDKLGVQGSPFGIGVMVELRPGPIPPPESYRK